MMKNIDPEWVKKYFLGECTPKEAERVLEWFRTPEGMRYLERHIDNNISQRMEDPGASREIPADSEEMFTGIQKRIREKSVERQKHRSARQEQGRRSSFQKNSRKWEGVFPKVAAAVLVAGFVAAFWLFEQRGTTQFEQEITVIEYATEQEQQRILTLADGTVVRLNENSSITIPKSYNLDTRHITMTGEVFFDVEHNEDLPFEITADEGQVHVLGTSFNVRLDSLNRHVQVAVLEGRVALRGNEQQEGSAAILTGGYFGVYNFDTRETIIEESLVQNYTSWMDGILEFENTPLWKISRQLQWMYDTSFRYADEDIRDLKLYASIPKDDLGEVLSIIASTLEIEYHIEDNVVVWRK